MTRQAGFTLLELLVGIVVLGLVMAGVAQGVQFGQRAAGTQERLIAAHADASAADRVLRRLVAGMEPGARSGPPRLEGHAANMAFTGDLGDAPALAGTRQAAIGLGVDAAHRLVMRYGPAPNAVPLAPPPPPATAVLLDGVDRVEFAYWDGAAWAAEWNKEDLPLLVRIRLRFTAGLRRSWPDIVAATERVRSQR